jgi:hypothetical protein
VKQVEVTIFVGRIRQNQVNRVERISCPTLRKSPCRSR